MIFDPPPRRRAIVRFFLPGLVVVAVVVALIVSASGEQTRAELDYLEEVQTQAFEFSKGGDALRSVVSHLHRVDRTEFVTVVEQLRDDLAAALEFTSLEPPTPSLLPTRAMYHQVLSAWDDGMAAFAAAVLEAADDLASTVVVDNMANALAELRAGDSLYAGLIADMEREDVPRPLTEMPQVLLMPAQGSLLRLSVAYIESARSPNSGLALRPGLGLSQIVSDPDWRVNPSDQVVIPATETVVFSVVVTNAGNVVSRAEVLTITLTGGPEQLRVRSEVSPLQPNQQVTLVFDPLGVEPGGIYEVAATLVVTGGDSTLDDNELVVEFLVNEP